MENKFYYLSEKLFYGNTAGTKARNDLEVFFSERYEKLGPKIVSKEKTNFFYYVNAYIKSKMFVNKLKHINNSVIIFQYPVTRGKVLIKYIKKICKKNKIVFFIHDVNYLRDEEINKKEEIELLNCASIIICHNERMKAKLVSDGLNVKDIYCLDCFDYLIDNDIDNYVFEKSVVYAGNLDKGGFLGKLAETKFDFKLNLFGPNYNLVQNNSITYCGSFKPDEVPYKLNASYGLIWDSLDINTCTGKLGYYTKFNNPHKMSLYITSGIPVICWSQSAISDFVKKNNIGIVIDSLADIDNELNKIDENHYKILKENVKKIQAKVSKGLFTKYVLDLMENDLKK